MTVNPPDRQPEIPARIDGSSRRHHELPALGDDRRSGGDLLQGAWRFTPRDYSQAFRDFMPRVGEYAQRLARERQQRPRSRRALARPGASSRATLLLGRRSVPYLGGRRMADRGEPESLLRGFQPGRGLDRWRRGRRGKASGRSLWRGPDQRFAGPRLGLPWRNAPPPVRSPRRPEVLRDGRGAHRPGHGGRPGRGPDPGAQGGALPGPLPCRGRPPPARRGDRHLPAVPGCPSHGPGLHPEGARRREDERPG